MSSKNLEIEAQILYIEYDDIISKLTKLGAKMEFDWTKFRIGVFYPCLSKEEREKKYDMIFTRVRDEGNKTTITTKTKLKNSVNKFANEYEIETQNTFEDTMNLLKANHLTMKAYQERLRQKWLVPSHPYIKEVVFDMWPGLPIYMEIEATTERNLIKFMNDLDVNKKNIRFYGAQMIYEELYGIPLATFNDNTPFLTFKTINKNLGKSINKNVTQFKKNVLEQKKYLKRFGYESLYKN